MNQSRKVLHLLGLNCLGLNCTCMVPNQDSTDKAIIFLNLIGPV